MRSFSVCRPFLIALALVVSATGLAAQRAVNPSNRAEPATAASPNLIGTWSGALGPVPIVLHIAAKTEGGVDVTLDSPNQGAMGLVMLASLSSPTQLRATLLATVEFEGELDAAGKLVGRWTQGAVTPVQLTRVDASPTAGGPARPQQPGSFPYRAENVRYPNTPAGFDLAGTLTLPQGAGPFPAVVLISGSGPQDRDGTVLGHKTFLVLADHLTRQGIAVLRSDDRGVGASRGNAAGATSQDFAGDVRAALAYLRTRPEIRKDAIGLAGLSEGGLIAPIVAADDPQIAFVVLMAGPGLPGEEIMYLQGEAILRSNGMPQEIIDWNRGVQRRMFAVLKATPDTAVARTQLELALPPVFDALTVQDRTTLGLTTPALQNRFIASQIAQVNNAWIRYFLTYDPRPTLARVKSPVLGLGGSLDTQVPAAANLAEIRKALTEGGNKDVTTTELPSLNHLFQTAVSGSPNEYPRITETFAPAALEAISKWILEKTRGR
jgi:uncharacterized protein